MWYITKMDSAFDRILMGTVDDPEALLSSEVDLWLKGDSGFAQLHAYLGMSYDEYMLWVESNDIKAIVKMRGPDSHCNSCDELKKEIAALIVDRDRWLLRNADLERRLVNIRREAK